MSLRSVVVIPPVSTASRGGFVRFVSFWKRYGFNYLLIPTNPPGEVQKKSAFVPVGGTKADGN